MNKFTILIIIFCGLLNATPIFAKKQKKNVVMIYTDDHRYSGVHCLGKQAVLTPNLDRLADNGFVFHQAFLMGSITGATCVPSRAMLQTGRNMFQLKGEGRHIPQEHTTIGEAFQQADYDTYMIGKWHQDNASLARSYNDGATVMSLGLYLVDHFRMPLWDWDTSGVFPKSEAYLLEYNSRGETVRRSMTKSDKRGQFGDETKAPHTSEIFAESAVNYIKQKHKKPFFMYLAFHAPHDPRQAPKRYRDLYPTNEMTLPDSYAPQHPFDNGHMYLRDECLASFPRSEEEIKKHLSDYYSAITHLDAQIGKVIEVLKATGQYENTIIVVAGDSGLAVGNHGLMGKQNVYDEDGVHVPFIISGGIHSKNKGTDALVYIHDIFPTVCDLAGIKKPESVTGKSMASVISGDIEQIRNYTYHAYRQHQRAYRRGEYKLIEFVRAPDYDHRNKREIMSGSRTTMLYNIKNDPWETTNLAFLPDYYNMVQSMRKEMRAKALELGDNKANLQDRYIPRLSAKYDFWDYYTE